MGNKKKIRFKVIDIFHKLDSYGHTTNIDWFLLLNKFQLLRFIRELKDIWFHRLDISNDIKKRIYPPHGNPFLTYHPTFLMQKDIFFIQNYVIQMIDNMITKGMTNDFRTLGVFYILTALTLVSSAAAGALPWLYDSAQNYPNIAPN